MIQKKYNSPNRYKPPQKFVPRRDLFPDAVIPAEAAIPLEQGYSKPSDLISTPRPSIQRNYDIQKNYNMTGNVSSRKIPLTDYSPMTPVKSGNKRSNRPETLMLLFAGLLLLWPNLKKLGWIGDPKSLEMLLSIGPYLSGREQDAVYTAAGVLEAFQTINDVMNHSYHTQRKAAVMQVPSSPAARRIEAMKAIKPYIKPDSRQHLDRFVNLYDSMHKIRSNLAIYRNNRSLAGNEGMSSLESVNEILKVIKPILPKEYRERADKATQLFKMAEAISSAEKLNRETSRGKSNKRSDNKDSISIAKNNNSNGSEEQNEKIQKLMDSLTPMLNGEQKESMNMIMKMAQLLSQTDSSEETNHEEK